MLKTRNELLCCLFGIAAGGLLIANVLGAKTFVVGGVTLPCSVLIFPVTYIVSDMLSEVFGFKTAMKAALLAFGMNLVAVVCFLTAIALPEPSYAHEGAEAFAMTVGSSPRILVASFTAYLVGVTLNNYIMVKLKEKLESKLAFRCIASTLVGESVDACIFLTLAFFGQMPNSELLVMIVGQAMFKTGYECIIYPVTKRVIGKAKRLPDGAILS